MSDMEEPKEPKIADESAALTKKKRDRLSKLAAHEFPLHLSFYDASSLRPLEPKQDQISFYRVGSKDAKLEFDAVDRATFILSGIEEAGLIEMMLASPVARGCDRFVAGSVAFMARPGVAEACTVHSPLFPLERSCTVRFHAYDASDPDDIDDKEAQLDGVNLVLTPVRVPRAHHDPATGAFNGGTLTATTAGGIAEINGVTQQELYRLQVLGPEGYICRNVPEFVQTCCEPQIDIPLAFEPCNCLPAPTFIFLRDGCGAMRCGKMEFEAGGQSRISDQHGIWTVPVKAGEPKMMGQITLSHPQRSFNPAQFDLDENTPPVFLVRVAERVQLPSAPMVRGRFLDEDDCPLSRRMLTVMLPDGTEHEVCTDENGHFHAPKGAHVYTKGDDVVHAGPMLLLTE